MWEEGGELIKMISFLAFILPKFEVGVRIGCGWRQECILNKHFILVEDKSVF